MRAAKIFGLACLVAWGAPLDAEAGGSCPHCNRAYSNSDGSRSADYARSAYSNGLVRSSGLRYYVVRDSLADRTLYSGRTVDEMAREAARDEFERLERRSAEEGSGERTLSDTVMAALVERLVAKLLAGAGVAAPGDPNVPGVGPAPSSGAALKQRTESLAAEVEYRRKQLEEELKVLNSVEIKVHPETQP